MTTWALLNYAGQAQTTSYKECAAEIIQQAVQPL
jgi:hypothetical protein